MSASSAAPASLGQETAWHLLKQCNSYRTLNITVIFNIKFWGQNFLAIFIHFHPFLFISKPLLVLFSQFESFPDIKQPFGSISSHYQEFPIFPRSLNKILKYSGSVLFQYLFWSLAGVLCPFWCTMICSHRPSLFLDSQCVQSKSTIMWFLKFWPNSYPLSCVAKFRQIFT